MERFIRLQSESYEIDENSRSFEWDLKSIEYAMYDALQNMIELESDPINFSIAHHHEELRRELDEMRLGWDNIDPIESERIKELYEEWSPSIGLILDGVSCYNFNNEQEAAEKLFHYFKERNPKALKSGYYVLIFEGIESFDCGHNGEEVAKYVRDVERVPVGEFFSRYGIEVTK